MQCSIVHFLHVSLCHACALGCFLSYFCHLALRSRRTRALGSEEPMLKKAEDNSEDN